MNIKIAVNLIYYLVFSVLEWTHVEGQGRGVTLPKITPPTPTVISRALRAIRIPFADSFLNSNGSGVKYLHKMTVYRPQNT